MRKTIFSLLIAGLGLILPAQAADGDVDVLLAFCNQNSAACQTNLEEDLHFHAGMKDICPPSSFSVTARAKQLMERIRSMRANNASYGGVLAYDAILDTAVAFWPCPK